MANKLIKHLTFPESNDKYEFVVKAENIEYDENNVISEQSFTSNNNNLVGLRGYYWSYMKSETVNVSDGEGGTITEPRYQFQLSLSQTETVLPKEDIIWEKNKSYITIVNDKHYDSCAVIKSIDNINKTVSVAQKDFPFSERVIMDENELDWDDYGIFVADMPTAGEVDLGKYTTAIGENNVVSERAATAIGRQNVVQGKYGVALGRGNIIKVYAGVATGAFNTIEAEALYSNADGLQNTVTAPIAHAGGSNSKAAKDGADADGYKCEAYGEWSLARNYKTKATAPYAVALNEETEAGGKSSLATGLGTKTTDTAQTAVGKYNHSTSSYLFMVDMGTSDTDRKNAMVVRKDGIVDMWGHRIYNLANAVVDTDAVNLRMLNAGLAEKAPAGYGLGEIGGDYVENINIVRNGWYRITPSTIGGIGNFALVRVDAEDERSVHQTAYSGHATSAGFIVMKRMCYDGAWGEWEYENPPMILDQKYRTTERVNGMPVYVKLVNCGRLPNNDSISVDIDANIKINLIADHELFICYLGNTDLLYYEKSQHENITTDIEYNYYPNEDGSFTSDFFVNINTTANMSGWLSVLFVKWTEIE